MKRTRMDSVKIFGAPERRRSKTEAMENEMQTHRCIGSHAKKVTHFECPLRGSPIGLPVFGSQSLTCMCGCKESME